MSCAAGATGGFAGGEAGLKQYVATGEVKLRDPNQPTQRQTSPVAVAGLLVAAGAGGGLLLNELTDVGEGALKAEILNVSQKGCSQQSDLLGCLCVVGRWGSAALQLREKSVVSALCLPRLHASSAYVLELLSLMDQT